MASTKAIPPKANKHKRKISMKDLDCPTVYSNFMGVGASPFDLSIMFGEVDLSGSIAGEATPKVKIIMAPEQADNLIRMMRSVLDRYIEANGPLRPGGMADLSGAEDSEPTLN